jgi:DNA-binding transcriptional LysR family regulator
MSLQRLRTFTEVYRHGSISAAARALELTQPAVSQHIATLESMIGRKLFDRRNNGVVPTVAAHELAKDLGDRLDAAEMALAAARVRSEELAGTIQIAGQSDFLSEFLTPHLLPLLDDGMLVRLHAAGPGELEQLLLDGQCDLAIAGFVVNDRRLRTENLLSQPVLAVASPDLADEITAAPDIGAALRSAPLLAYTLERSLVDFWASKQGVTVGAKPVAFMAHNLHALRTLIMCGYGWTAMPEYFCRTQIAEGRLKAIAGPVDDPQISYHLVWAPSALRNPRTAKARQEIIRSFQSMVTT